MNWCVSDERVARVRAGNRCLRMIVCASDCVLHQLATAAAASAGEHEVKRNHPIDVCVSAAQFSCSLYQQERCECTLIHHTHMYISDRLKEKKEIAT